jgi:heme/copper-type cytochrome/quinol oxidase subunit 4
MRHVTGFQKFVIRAILGLGFSVVATRMFYGRVEIGYIVGLAVILVGLAYFAEYLRHRKNR